MQTSFTGLQNIGIQKAKRFGGQIDSYRIVIQATDKGAQDVWRLRDIFEKFPAKDDKKYLVFEYVDFKNDPKATSRYTLNGKYLRLDRENMIVFQKMAKLLKRVSKYEKKFEVSNRYLISKDFLENFSMDPKTLLQRWRDRKIAREMHNPQKVKDLAEGFMEQIQKDLTKFFYG